MNIYNIYINKRPYLGEDPEKTYESGEPWQNGFSQSHKFQANQLIFGKINDKPKQVIGNRSLKNELDRIIRRIEDDLIIAKDIRIILQKEVNNEN